MAIIAHISSGSNLSNGVSTNKNKFVIGLEIPELDNCTLYLQASENGSTYRRVLKSDGSDDWSIPNTIGDRFIFIDQIAPFKYYLIESSVVQTADRDFKFIVKDEP